jgi:DNA polymerase
MDKGKELARMAVEISGCSECKKWGTGRAVPGEGSPNARIAFIGEAPGKEEAKTGRPFVGRSGRLLRETLRSIGLREEEVFITSPVHYLPSRGTPSKENIVHGRIHLTKQLSVIDPAIIVLLGNTACIALLDRKAQITKEHGSVVRANGRVHFITFHPAYALRFPKGRKEFIADFEKLKRLIEKKP